MAKRTYSSPKFFGLEVGDDPVIVQPPSQTTSGYDAYVFEEIDEAVLTMIDANCDDYDLQDMDANGNHVITLAEFQAWWESQEEKPW